MNQFLLAFKIAPIAQCLDLDPGINDTTLVQNAQAGDVESLDCRFCLHRPSFRRRAERACGDPAAAEDICQEACLKAIDCLDRFVAGRSFRAWVFAFIDNEAKNSRRNLKIFCTRNHEIDIDIIETMSAGADSKSEADMTIMLALLSRQVPELRPSRRQTAIVMIEYYATEREFPTVRLIAQATHCSQGAAQINRQAVLASWRHILTASELELPNRQRAVL